MITDPDLVQPHITCPRCGLTSYNPTDILEGYCGHCHDWTRRPGRIPNPTDDPFGGHVTITIAPTHVCPECATGKHGNCDGTAWDNNTDDYTRCACANNGHTPTNSAGTTRPPARAGGPNPERERH